MRNPMLCAATLVPILLAASATVHAQQAPNASSQLQQIPPLPERTKTVPELRIEKGAGQMPGQSTPASDSTTVTVRSLNITGAQAYSTADVIAASGFTANSTLTLAELRSLTERITQYYQRNGYFLAQAYLPPQNIQDGNVTIAILEGQYGQVSINNSSNLSLTLAKSLLAGVSSGKAINTASLENRLLLLNDLPGVVVKSTLVPGASVGAADLIVDVIPSQRVTGTLEADNDGNRYTGKNRIGGSVNVNNPFGLGDVASARVLTSGSGLAYLRTAYQAQWGRAKLGAAYAHVGYRLGDSFSDLEATGTANIASVFGSYPLLRSRMANLAAQLNFDSKILQDKVNGSADVTDKRIQVASASLVGDFKDNLGGASSNNYTLSFSAGKLDIQSAAALAADAATSQANGNYTKLAFSGARLQPLSASTALFGSIRGQFSSKNLDPSEKIGLGGANGVRAYPEGEAYSDQGYLATLELRATVAQAVVGANGQLQLIGFIDTGTGTINKNLWAGNTGSTNQRTLSAVGLGLNWVGANNLVIKADYAHKLGNAVATSAPDSMSRFWLQAVKYF
jgi:hemolysin activation/secretion protein